MAHIPHKPVLFVDIDGVISLWGFPSDRRPPGSFHAVEGILHFLSARAGEHLQRLSGAFELVWCSGWEERANEHLPRALGLPGPLPHLRFEHGVGGADATRAHWKLAAIDAYAGDRRAVAWIDDAFNDDCHAWAYTRPGPTLLVRTDPATGLTVDHVHELVAWATAS